MSIKPTQPPVPTSRPTSIPTRPPTPQPITPQPMTKLHTDPTPTAGPTPSPTRAPTHQPITPQPAAAPPTTMPTSTITNTETMIEGSPMQITRFVLVDAETNSDISGGLYCLPSSHVQEELSSRIFALRQLVPWNRSSLRSVDLLMKQE
jgi:hypothetical protein